MKSTVSPKPAEIDRHWYLVDAAGVPVGRLSSTIAKLILGKGKSIWAPHVDCGDFVIVVNAEKAVLTGAKERAKVYYRHTTQKPGSLKSPRRLRGARASTRRAWSRARSSACCRRPSSAGSCARSSRSTPAAQHPHQAQKPTVLDLAAVKM